MATHFRFAHDFDIDAKDYWDIFFSEDYNAELYRRLKMKTRTVVSDHDDGKIRRRVQKMSPEMEMPGFMKSIVSDISYTESNTFWHDRSEMEVVITPATMANKFEFKAIYGVKGTGPGKVRRTFEGDSKVSIMIVGGQIEKFLVEEMRKSYDVAAEVTRQFIAKRKAAV